MRFAIKKHQQKKEEKPCDHTIYITFVFNTTWIVGLLLSSNQPLFGLVVWSETGDEVIFEQ